MKKILFATLLVLSGVSLFSQTGFYRNLLGSFNPNLVSVPILSHLDTCSDGGYIISGSPRPNAPYCVYVKLDSAFNTEWTQTYNSTANGVLSNAVELDDHGFVGVFCPDQVNVCFNKTDSQGNILFSKYYTLGSSGYLSTGNVCRSAEGDSGFVAIYSACAMHYGLAKFDKDGNPEWVKEFGSAGYLGGSVYDINLAYGSGYLSCGQFIDPNTDQRSGVVARFGNNGQVIHSKKIFLDSNSTAIHTGIKMPSWSKSDNTYYAAGFTFHGTPFVVDNSLYLVKMDTSLNPVSCWRFDGPNTNTQLFINNLATASDGTVIIDGIMQDTVTYVYKFYMLKFNPATGSIEWSKSVRALSSPQWYFSSSAISGIDFYGPNDDIVFPLYASNDGTSIASIDLSGNGLCIAIDTNFSVTPHTIYTSANIGMSGSPVTFMQYPNTVTTLQVTYNDTLFCGPLSVDEPLKNTEAEQLFSIQISQGITNIQSVSDEPLDILIFSATGQLLAQEKLAPQASVQKNFAAAGLYLIQANSTQNRQVEKIMFPGN